MRQKLIATGFSMLGATRLHRMAPDALRGRGAILMFHHVRPYIERSFEPNRLLEITPAFLDAVLTRLGALGYEIASLDDALARFGAGEAASRPLAVLTFDDGYRDNLIHALPILERHRAPFTCFVTPGFADRTARLWWIELEEAIRRAPAVEVEVGAEHLRLPSGTPAEKRRAFEAIYCRLRAGSEDQLLATVGALRDAHRVDGRALVEALCAGWDDIRRLAAHPLATIGAHTMTHPRLAKLAGAEMRAEIADSRLALETQVGAPVRNLAYPVGDPGSAGAREFAAARDLGFASAVTTRPGLVYADHANHLTALPRVSINGRWQDLRHLDVLLSGAAFALWNRGRRVNAA